MFCPSCKQPLIVLELDNIEVDYCTACEGVWFDAGEYAMILYGNPDTDGDRLLCGGDPGKRPCPACGTAMDVTVLPYSDIELDHCPREHGVWFDRGELERVLDAKYERKNVMKLKAHCMKLFASTRTSEKPAGNL